MQGGSRRILTSLVLTLLLGPVGLVFYFFGPSIAGLRLGVGESYSLLSYNHALRTLNRLAWDARNVPAQIRFAMYESNLQGKSHFLVLGQPCRSTMERGRVLRCKPNANRRKLLRQTAGRCGYYPAP